MADSTKSKLFSEQTQESRELSLWRPRLRSAEADHQRHRADATGRSRDLVLTSAHAKNALRIHGDSVVGPFYRLALKPIAAALGISQEAANEWAQQAESLWETYANGIDCDVDAQRVQNMAGLMRTGYSSFLMAGEGLATIKWKPSVNGWNTCVLLLEPERLSQPDRSIETPRFQKGIEIDEDGAPIAYHIRAAHPSDVGVSQWRDEQTWIREERVTPWGRPRVIHMVDRYRPGMIRGMSAFVTAVRSMKLLDMSDSAELETAILQTGIAAVITSELPRADAFGVMGARPAEDMAADAAMDPYLAHMASIAPFHGELGLTHNGSKFAHLLPGEKIEMVKPEVPQAAYEAFQTSVLRKIAAGLGTSAESLSRNFTDTSYAAAQMALEDIWRHYLSNRALLNHQFGLPIVAAFLEEAIDTQRLPLPNGKMGTFLDWVAIKPAVMARSTFMSWGKPPIDPIKERKGQQLALTARLTTLADEAAHNGQDYRELLEQQARERAEMTRLGIPLPEELSAEGQIASSDDKIGGSGEEDRE